MEMLDDFFVADAVTHAYNMHPSNYAVEKYAKPVAENMASGVEQSMPPGYRRTKDSLVRDWDIEETGNLLFRESQIDFTVFHPQSITMFEDGLTSKKKAREFTERYPTRGAALASVDLIGMDDPFQELTRQVEEFDPHGVKVYPSYWDGDEHHSFKMDDPELAFPLWEHVKDLGLDVVAVHKAVPFGPVPMDPYKVDDIDEAAASFPDLNFEIVHGGVAFAEETGWQIGRHPNVYVNLEITGAEALLTPATFVETMKDLLWAGGKDAIDKILWGSGAPHFHPQLMLEAFWEFDFPEMEWRGGKYTITEEDKRKMIGENLAEVHGFDIDELQREMAGDEFTHLERVTDPYSTTDFEVVSS